jgi:hypothetical protein
MPDTTPKEQSDTSQRARSLARLIDRLEPGTYNLEITKPSCKTDNWQFALVQPVTIRKGTLPKENVEQT